MLGLAAAEVGGLLKPATPAILTEVRNLSSTEFPNAVRLLPVFERQEPGRIYALMVDALLDGIEHQLGDRGIR